MKRLNSAKTILLLTITSLMLSFYSCSDDEETDPKKLIIGNWTLDGKNDTDIKIYINDTLYETWLTKKYSNQNLIDSFADLQKAGYNNDGLFTFNSDKTYIDEIEKGTWELNEDNTELTLEAQNSILHPEPQILELISVSKSTLIIGNVYSFNIDTDLNGTRESNKRIVIQKTYRK